MTREELLRCETWWITEIQLNLYNEILSFMKKRNMNSTQLAEYLGCSKAYVSQLLNGNFDHKLSKLVQLSLAIGKVPILEYKDMDDYVREDAAAIAAKQQQEARQKEKAPARRSARGASSTASDKMSRPRG